MRSWLVPLLAAALVLPVAPAGASTVIYSCGRDLCAIAPDGTGGRQLTSDGTDVRPYTWPSLSQDGTRMAWIRNGDLFLGNAAAQPSVGPVVRSAQFARLRPDGAQVAALVMSFVFTGDFLYVYDSGGATVLSGPRPDAYSAGWAPDGSLLVPWSFDGHVGICTIAQDPATKTWDCATRVARDPAADLNFPAVSPDGRLLAVDDGGRIAVFDVGSHALLRTVTAGTTDTAPVWSPDSAAIAYQRGSGGSTEVRVVGADGSGDRLLAAGGQAPTWGGPADTAAPTPAPAPTAGAVARSLSVTRSQRGRSVRARITIATTGARLRATLTTTSGRRRTLGTLTRKGLYAGSLSLKVPLSTAGRSALKRAGTLKLRLTVAVTAGGTTTTLTAPVRLRR